MPDTMQRQYEQHRLDVQQKSIEDDELMSSLGLPGDVSLWDATREGLIKADVLLGGPAVRGAMDAPGGPASPEDPFTILSDEGSIRSALTDLGTELVGEEGVSWDVATEGLGVEESQVFREKLTQEQAGKIAPFLVEMGLYGGVAGGLTHVYGIAGKEGMGLLMNLADDVERLAPEVVTAARQTLKSEAGMVGPPIGEGPPIPSTSTTETAAEKIARKAAVKGEPVPPSKYAALPEDLRGAQEAAWTEYDEILTSYRKHMEGMSAEEISRLKPGEFLPKAERKRLNKYVRKQSDATRRAAKKYMAEPTPENLVAFEASMRTVQEGVESRLAIRAAEGGIIEPEFGILYKEAKGISLKKDLRGNPQRIAETVSHMTNKQIAEFSANLEGIFATRGAYQKTGDAITEAIINVFYLSHPKTHIANVMGNTVAVVSTPIDRFMAGWLVHPTKSSAIKKGEFAQMMYAWVESLGEAVKVGAKELFAHPATLKKAVRGHRTKLDYQHLNAMTAESFTLEGSMQTSMVDWISSYTVKLPSRGLFAADEFFKTILRRMETRAVAYREAVNNGLRGREAWVDYVAGQVKQPSAAIAKEAEKFALTNTFQNQLGPKSSAVFTAIRDTGSVPVDIVSHALIPFVKTPMNLFHFANKRTPVAWFYKELKGKLLRGAGVERDLALGQLYTGIALMGYVSTLAYDDRVTGEGPRNPVLRQAWIAQGYQPNSIKVAGEWRKYDRLDPVAKIVGLTSDVMWAFKTAPQLKEDDWDEAMSALIPAYVRNFTEGTWMPGISDMLDVATSDNVDKWEAFLRRQGTRITPGAVRFAEQIQDPRTREAVGFVEKSLQKNFPWWSEELPPRRNILGEEMWAPGSVWNGAMNPFYSMKPGYENDPIWMAIEENQTEVYMPPKVKRVGGEEVELTSDQYDSWLLFMNVVPINNMDMKTALYTLIGSDYYNVLEPGPRGGRSVEIKKLINDFKEEGFRYLWQTDKSLFDGLTEAQAIEYELRYGEVTGAKYREMIDAQKMQMFKGTQ